MSIERLTNQTAKFYPTAVQYDRFGKDVWDESKAITNYIRFQPSSKTTLGPGNEVLQIDAIMMTRANVKPKPEIDQRIIFDGIDYRVVKVSARIGGDGQVHHYSLEVRRWES